jgi:hypothetical protein
MTCARDVGIRHSTNWICHDSAPHLNVAPTIRRARAGRTTCPEPLEEGCYRGKTRPAGPLEVRKPASIVDGF